MENKEFREILESHKLWLSDKSKGKRADLSRKDLSNLDLIGVDLSEAKLECAKLNGMILIGTRFERAEMNYADFRNSELIGACFNEAKMRESDMRNCTMSKASFLGADLDFARMNGIKAEASKFIKAEMYGVNLTGARLIGVDFFGSNMKNAKFNFSDMRNTCLDESNLSGSDLSGAIGLLSPSDFIKEHFEKCSEGIIAYKTFNEDKQSPKSWMIKPGSIINENANFDRCGTCECGINVATLDWIKNNRARRIWKVLIRWEWLPGVCVPYGSDGRIRCERVELLEIVDRKK